MTYEKAVPNEEVHMVPLEESNVRVSIDVVKVGKAFLPIPIPEGLHSVGTATVGEAVGFHVAWPKSLILFAPEVGSKKPGMFGDEATPKNQDCRNNLELPNINKSQQCRLAVGSVNNIVALGTMFWKSGPNELLHTVPLGEDHMRVSIDVVKVKDALLPIPISEEVATVGDAVGWFVAWPKDLIFFAPEVASKKPSMVGNEAVYKKPRMTGNKNALKHHGVVGRKVVGDEVTSKNVEWESNLEYIEIFTTLTKHTDKMEAFQIPIDDDIFGAEVDAKS
ncbi:uncharacterized protein LOC131311701 isoform X1 [Rhododendron vialii]|uniref:uncharacterized protein LOC131311701 isoform X1 n=1 Tax=Rhododendron vialii TaxID=182163 RepID=UPI00265E9D58|nr:uncharacterized protein LOC131311701 isoform X1 [Rhododendron vialii]XP_058195236.1 uncharacterized protein LOC131311701 isoform X1 [Rhododendron vialii]XP_058195237.1 uncharacterized protein LOC131311701 isoform X1 [Rhododendron vialii]XP_058195240.1 uncharacterized protein LOC131311701 isoform X1 [Rhododendron vialii]XP_058195241.1 uncharacterized protein LOC131311701 isoform X1 [Rhododendron vialii]